MENFVNELKLKLNELNDLVKDFEIESLKQENESQRFNIEDHIKNGLSADEISLIRDNYSVEDIFDLCDIFESAGSNAQDIDDVFPNFDIRDYANDRGMFVFEDESDIIDYVRDNMYIEDMVEWR